MSQERLLEIIESFRRKDHYYVDEDCWYSCPAHKDYCGEGKRICLCGLAEHNAKVDEALLIVRGLTRAEPDAAQSRRFHRRVNPYDLHDIATADKRRAG